MDLGKRGGEKEGLGGVEEKSEGRVEEGETVAGMEYMRDGEIRKKKRSKNVAKQS